MPEARGSQREGLNQGGKLLVIVVLGCVVIAAIGTLAWAAAWLESQNLGLAIPIVVFIGAIALAITIALVIGLLSLLGVRRPAVQVGAIWQFGVLIILAGAFSVGTVATVVLAANTLKERNLFRPEIILPLLLLTGLIALVIALAILVGAFHLFRLTTPNSPFGVPEGTLQAVIALTIILIFAVSALYLRGSLDPQIVAVRGLTAEQVAAIPGDQILGSRAVEGALFDVDRRLVVDQDAKDFSNQLLTILGTLVGAVAGFYFGAKSVETGISVGGGATAVQPTNVSPPTISGRAQVGEALRAEPGGWTGSPPPTHAYQWQFRAPDESEWSDIRDANEASYVVVSEDTGHRLRVMVSATNSAGTASAPSPPSDPVAQPPVNTRPPRVVGLALEGETLEADAGQWSAWPELGPTSFSYQWERGDAAGTEWTSIAGASLRTYRPTREDVAGRVRVRVTATNIVGSTQAISEQSDVISGAPENTAPPTLSGEPVPGGTLTASSGEWKAWPELGPASFSYQWERTDPGGTAWNAIPGANQASYQVTPEDDGKRLRMHVTATNTVGRAEAPSDEVLVPETEVEVR